MSKLNPQKATAYVGPGVLRKGGKITPVPDGHLIKKTGKFKGSTLKTGGPIKKAQGSNNYITKEGNIYTSTKKVNTKNGPRYYQGKSPNMSFATEIASEKARKINDSIPKVKLSARALEVMNQKNGGPIRKAKNGTTTTQTTTPVNKPTWQQMTQAEKSAKRAELISKGGMERFKQYKDSISADAKNRLETQFAEGAAKRGMTPAEYSAYIKKQAKGGDAQLEGLDIKGSCKRGETKGSCRTGQSNRGESLRDNKRNGGSIKNNKLGIMNKKKNGGPIKGTNAQLTLPKPKKLSTKEMKAPAKVDISKFKKAKSGAMIKRADGSMSRRGLWDNIRAAAKKNKAAGKPGKKPTAAMLQQERKIKAKSKK